MALLPAPQDILALEAASVLLLLLLVPAHAPRASAQRPALPDTFVPINQTAFPTLTGSCAQAIRKITVGPNSTFKSLSAAVLAAKPRTRIEIAAGRYTATEDEYSEGAVANINKDDLCIVGAPGGRVGMLQNAVWF